MLYTCIYFSFYIFNTPFLSFLSFILHQYSFLYPPLFACLLVTIALLSSLSICLELFLGLTNLIFTLSFRNNYYGSCSTSFNLDQLYEHYLPGKKPSEALGKSRDYNIDLAPKFIISAGNLVKLLLHTKTTHYMDFKPIIGSYVFHKGKLHKVPATDGEALKSSLMGIFEKRRCQKFLVYVQGYKRDDPSTHNGYDLTKMTSSELFSKFSLDENTQDFLGHASALYTNDEYLSKPALDLVERLQLYSNSLGRYSNSPYIYPLYGLGELPQAFSRLSAVYGGVYMLSAPIKEVKFNADGTFLGVESSEEGNPVAKAKFVVADPTYFPDKVKKVGDVVKVICILSHPVPNTDNSESCQIIIPQKQVKRKSDIYIAVMSSANCVVPKGKFVAIVSTTVETSNPETECDVATKLLGPIDEKFTFVEPLFEPLADGTQDKVFISKSYDATSHFESTVDDCLDMYRRITGKDFVFKETHEDDE